MISSTTNQDCHSAAVDCGCESEVRAAPPELARSSRGPRSFESVLGNDAELDEVDPPEEVLRARSMQRRHRMMLATCSLVVLLSFLLQVRDDQRVEFRCLPGHPLPHSCTMRLWFGHGCPGCGLTRSFIHLADGDLSASLAVHRLGWLIALAALAQFPYRLLALRQTDGRLLGTRIPKLFSACLIVLLIGNWVLRIH